MGDKEHRSKEKLLGEIKNEITVLFEKSLDYAQIACPSPDVYKALRSKILRVGNDCIRNLEKRAKHYNIEYIPQMEEIIEVIKR